MRPGEYPRVSAIGLGGLAVQPDSKTNGGKNATCTVCGARVNRQKKKPGEGHYCKACVKYKDFMEGDWRERVDAAPTG